MLSSQALAVLSGASSCHLMSAGTEVAPARHLDDAAGAVGPRTPRAEAHVDEPGVARGIERQAALGLQPHEVEGAVAGADGEGGEVGETQHGEHGKIVGDARADTVGLPEVLPRPRLAADWDPNANPP